jgi:hypothetical protein
MRLTCSVRRSQPSGSLPLMPWRRGLSEIDARCLALIADHTDPQ